MEYDQLKHEYHVLNDKMNYVMNSIRTFWSPELKKERQQRKEEAYSLQHKLCQQAVRKRGKWGAGWTVLR
jgi:hypothetical protein